MHRRCATGGRRGREGFIFGDATDVDMWYCAVAVVVVVGVVVTVMFGETTRTRTGKSERRILRGVREEAKSSS
jgi:hypothetical protein